MTAYVDSSFLVSLYVTDLHSREARSRMATTTRLCCTPLHIAEWAHVLTQHLFRGQLNVADVTKLQTDFDQDLSAGLWYKVDLPENALDLCADLARRHGAKLGMRTLNSLHVACALELKAHRFWTFDDRQAKLARAEGLRIT